MPDDATPPSPGPEHERLRVFMGKWRAEGFSYAEGQTKADPKGSARPWTSHEIFEMAPGDFFLVQRWDAAAGDKPFRGIGMTGWDAKAGQYVTDTYDSLGFHQTYVTEVDGDVWTFTGKTERARIEFTDPETQVVTWEWKPGRSWMPLCDRTARRVGRVSGMPRPEAAAATAPAEASPDDDVATPAEAPAPRTARARRRPARARSS